MRVDLAGLAVEGVSLGGIHTCLQVPEYKLALDMGVCPLSAAARPTVLFTHGHVDHMGAVARHAALRNLRGMAPPTYVVPPEYRAGLEDLLAVWRRLDRSSMPCELVELAPGQELELRPGLVARPFVSPHSAPCQGYLLKTRRHKLRAEYASLPGEEIRRLRVDEGVEVTRPVDVPELAYTGDTSIDVLEREPELLRVRRLILEVTFLDERVSVADSRAMGHVHLDELVERASLFECEAILLTHFSSRYRREEVLEALERRLPAELAGRVTALL